MSDGDFGGQRGRREAFETRAKEDIRARREANEARAVRNRLEKHASIGERADIVSRLNMVSENDVVIQRGAVAVLDAMRTRVNTPRNPEYAEPGIKPFLPGRTSVAPGLRTETREKSPMCRS